MKDSRRCRLAPFFTGYHPADVTTALGADIPARALFTTFTFSPGTFFHQYGAPLLHHGCPEITVLADAVGYAQSVFGAAAVEGIGTDYRLRQVTVDGAFHGKLVLVRTNRSVIAGVGSGNLTAPGLLTNAEVGALYRLERPEQLAAIDGLMQRLRVMALLEDQEGDLVAPIDLGGEARLLVSLDAPIFDQLDPPDDTQSIEAVSPFIDGQLEVVAAMRRRWPGARIRLRIDPGFGALNESLLSTSDDRVEVLVPAEPRGGRPPARRPPVHGKLVCFIGRTSATVVLGSANLSRPALLMTQNFEAVVERRLPREGVHRLLATPGNRWRKARPEDRCVFRQQQSPRSAEVLIAAATGNRLCLTWTTRAASAGAVRVRWRGRCVYEVRFDHAEMGADRDRLEIDVDTRLRDTLRDSCLAEVEFDDDGRLLRGWIEVEDRLGLGLEAKRQLVLLDAIASDPLGCEERDVVKFIELLQRNLKTGNLARFAAMPGLEGEKSAAEYDETPVARALLLETGVEDAQHSHVISRLVHRALDTALRDLRFFGRDSGRSATRGPATPAAQVGGAETGGGSEGVTLPPSIEAVLRELFDQLSNTLDAAESARDVAHLVSQIPTCIKGLAYAAERWLPKSERYSLLGRYVQPVVISCLAPGRDSLLCRVGALRRLGAAGRARLAEAPGIALGTAMLTAYLLHDFQSNRWHDGSFMKDMFDVLDELPAPPVEVVAAAGQELDRVCGAGNVRVTPNYGHLLSAARAVTGELAALRRRRESLLELITRVNGGVRDQNALRPLAEAASPEPGATNLLELMSAAAGRVRLVELEPDAHACPACHTALSVAARNRLNDATHLDRCNSCGVYLARALEG